MLSLLQRAVEQAHREEHPQLEVSTYHLAEHVKSGYEGMLIAVPAEHWPSAAGQIAQALANTLLRLARRILPRQVRTSKRAPKLETPKGYVHASIARSHMSRPPACFAKRGQHDLEKGTPLTSCLHVHNSHIFRPVRLQ